MKFTCIKEKATNETNEGLKPKKH